MRSVDSLIGQRFGKLAVMERSPNSGPTGKRIMWLCRCDCGNIGPAYSSHLKAGATKSCGCSMVSSGSDHVQWTGHGEISLLMDFWIEADVIQKVNNK